MIDYSKLPSHMQDGARLYIEKGIPGGSFFTAVVCNDLMEAFRRADDINSARMKEWVQFFYWEAPSGCWGSKEHHDQWVSNGGLLGLEDE